MLLKSKKSIKYNNNTIKGQYKLFANRENKTKSLQIPFEFNVNLNQINIQNAKENDSHNSLKSFISKQIKSYKI